MIYSSISNNFSEELYVEVQVGCPPGITLHFDNRASIATFASRGRGDVLGCLENNLDLPCVTLSGKIYNLLVVVFIISKCSGYPIF